MKQHFKVELKTNNGHITWEVYADNEAEAKIKAINEVIEQMEVTAYKVESITKEEE